MEKIRAALLEIFTFVGIAAATLAVVKAVGVSVPMLGGSIQDWAMVAVACAAGKLSQ